MKNLRTDEQIDNKEHFKQAHVVKLVAWSQEALRSGCMYSYINAMVKTDSFIVVLFSRDSSASDTGIFTDESCEFSAL